MKIKLTLLLALAGVAGTTSSLSAQVFAYSQRDVLLEFRKSGSPDFEVNLGPIDAFTLGNGGSFSLSGGGAHQYDAANLLANFTDLGSLTISLIGEKKDDTGSGEAGGTFWLSKGAASVGAQSTAPKDYTGSKSATISGLVNGIGVAAIAASTIGSPTVTYSDHEVSIQNNSVNSYTTKYNATGGLKSQITSPGIEKTTPADFTTNPGQQIRTDLYQYDPNAGTTASATFLGYVLLNSDGSASFTAVPEPSTYALCCAGALAVWALQRNIRRRRDQPLAAKR